MFDLIKKFEEKISKFTNAPFVVTTDCCTHALELCFYYHKIKQCNFTCYTYLSVVQTMHKLNINYNLIAENWQGEYRFHNTNIWDSARKLQPNMYKKGQLQCLSFGFDKPLNLGRGGAILLDNKEDYYNLSKLRYDGRDLDIKPWQSQNTFSIGFHYKLNPEECNIGIEKLDKYIENQNFSIKKVKYPDCRLIKIV